MVPLYVDMTNKHDKKKAWQLQRNYVNKQIVYGNINIKINASIIFISKKHTRACEKHVVWPFAVFAAELCFQGLSIDFVQDLFSPFSKTLLRLFIIFTRFVKS